MRELEDRVGEGERRTEEEVGRAGEVIVQLKEQLRATEEARREREEEVGSYIHTHACLDTHTSH